MFAVTVSVPTVLIALALVAIIVAVCVGLGMLFVNRVVNPWLERWKAKEIARVNAEYGSDSHTGSEQ